MNARGFGTLEAIVAVALLSLITAGIGSTVVLARRVQTDIALERQAMQLAIAAIERMRAGESAVSANPTPGFVITPDLTPYNGNARLLEGLVRVTWHAGEPRSLGLTTLIAR